MGLQLLTSILIAVALIAMQTPGMYSTRLLVPFLKQFHPDLVIESLVSNPASVAAGLSALYWFCRARHRGFEQRREPYGRSGRLAIGCTVIAAGALAVLTYVSGHANLPTISNCSACRRSAS